MNSYTELLNLLCKIEILYDYYKDDETFIVEFPINKNTRNRWYFSARDERFLRSEIIEVKD